MVYTKGFITWRDIKSPLKNSLTTCLVVFAPCKANLPSAEWVWRGFSHIFFELIKQKVSPQATFSTLFQQNAYLLFEYETNVVFCSSFIPESNSFSLKCACSFHATHPEMALDHLVKINQGYHTRKWCLYEFTNTQDDDVTVLFRVYVKACLLEGKPDPSGFKLSTMCLRRQKYQKSQTELNHIKGPKLQPQILGI